MSAIPDSPPGTRYVSESPREILAAVCGAFRQVPGRSLVIVGLVEGGRFGVSARIRLPAWLLEVAGDRAEERGGRARDDVRDIARPTLARFSAEGVRRVLLLVIGDPDPRLCTGKAGGGPGLAPSRERDAPPLASNPDGPRARLLDIAREAAGEAWAWGLDAGRPIIVDGSEMARLPEGVFAPVGSLHETAFARRERAAGRPYALDADAAALVSSSALRVCERRWASPRQGASSMSQPASAERRARDAIAALLRSGAGESRWLTGNDEGDLVSKCELLANALVLTSAREGRDAFFAAMMGEMAGRTRPVAEILEAVFETGTLSPNARISPGGDLFFVSRRALGLLDALDDAALDPTLVAGLLNLTAIHGLTSWFSGRFGECHAAASAILARDAAHEMAQYLAQMVRQGLTPAWLGPELMRTRPT